jgi:hypothetical protein
MLKSKALDQPYLPHPLLLSLLIRQLFEIAQGRFQQNQLGF